jgi:hypothetical protein
MSKNRTRVYIDSTPTISASAFKVLFDRSEGCNLYLRMVGIRMQSFKLALLPSEHSDIRIVSISTSGGVQLIKVMQTQVGCATRIYSECPICQQRKTALYLSSLVVGCRTCLRLNYQAQSESNYYRLVRKIRKRRADLWGGSEDRFQLNNLFVSSSTFEKPNGAWRSKYRRIIGEINGLESSMASKLNQMTRSR